MSTISVSIPEDDFNFLRALADSDGTTPEAFLARQTRLLRERFQRPLHPDVVALSGIVKADVNEKQAYHDYMEKKHS